MIAYGKIKHHGLPYDWSLRRQQENDYEFARNIMRKHARNRTLWAPKPIEHNGLIVCPLETSFSEIDSATDDIIIRRGVHADGVILHSALDVFLMTPADCATVVLSYKDTHGHRKIIAMHASRESLIDMSRFRPHKKPRRYEGIIESGLARVPKESLLSARAWVGISVSPGPHFAHRADDKNNPHNEFFVGYIREKYGRDCFIDDGAGGKLGWLDKRTLVKRMLALGGVPEENIELDSSCTYSERNEDGEPRWYSHIRDQNGHRNLVLVIRNH